MNTNISDLREYLNHLIASTNMKCLTPEKVPNNDMSVYLLFAVGLGRKPLESLYDSILNGRKFYSSPSLIYLGEQCFSVCNKVFLDGVASQHCEEKLHVTESCKGPTACLTFVYCLSLALETTCRS